MHLYDLFPNDTDIQKKKRVKQATTQNIRTNPIVSMKKCFNRIIHNKNNIKPYHCTLQSFIQPVFLLEDVIELEIATFT